METSRDEGGSCSTDVFDEAGNKSVAKSESLASCSSIQDLSESVRSANSTFSTPNVDSSNQNRVASCSKQKTANTSSRSISQQSLRSKPPTIVTKSDKKSEKLPSVTTTKSSTFVRHSSERRNSISNVSKNFVTENKTKASLPATKAQSRRFNLNPKTPTTSTTGSTRRNSLPGQVNDTNQTKKDVPINQLKVKGQDHKVLTNSQGAKALETVSTQRKNIGINVSQPTRTALQTQKKSNIHQGQIQDSDAATDQKLNKFNKSPVINIQNSKQNLQSQAKPQYRSPYSFNKQNSLKTGNTSSTNISSKYGGQSNVTKKSDKRTNSQNGEKLSASSSEKDPRTYLPHVNKTSKTLPESSTSVNSETLGKCVKESPNKLSQGRKNTQTANKKNLTVTNKSQETISLAITPPSSENSDAATEFSTEEQIALHMNRISPQPVKFPSNEEKVIGDQGNDLEFLELKETVNEKFSVDEVQNSSMISEKGNEDLLNNPDDSEISTILFDAKTLLEPGDLKDSSPYCPNQQNTKEAFLRAKKTSMKIYLHTNQIVMETFFGARKTSMKTYLEYEEALMEIFFQAEQVSPELCYKIEQAVFSFCSKIEKRNIEERLMIKREVEKLQSLIGNEDKEDGEDEKSKNSIDIDSYAKNSGQSGEDSAEVPRKSQVGGKLKSSEEKTEELKKSLQDLLDENQRFSEKCEFEILSLKNRKDAIESSLKNKEKSVGSPYLHNVKESIGEPFLQSNKDAEIALQKRNVTEILNSLQNEREEIISFLQNEEIAREIEAVETSLHNDKNIQLPLQGERESIDMSYLPKDEAVELPFLKNVKEAVVGFLQKEREVIDTALKELENSRETSLQNKTIESSLQNEEIVVEKALQCEEAVDMPSPLEGKEVMEISSHDNETVEMPSSQNSKDIQLPLQAERESVDMSYLPNDDSIEMPFLQNVRNAVGKFLQKETDDVETYLQKVKKTADIFFQNEVELSSQNEKVVHIALQCDKETIDMSHEDQDSEMSSLHQEKNLEVSLQEDKIFEMTSLQNNKDILLSSQIERESVDMSYLPNDNAVEMPFLHDVKESIEMFLQKEKDVNTSLQNVKNVTETSQNEETVQTALQHEEAFEMSSLHERRSEMSSLHEERDIETSLHKNETVETSLQDNKDIQLPSQIEGESVDMSYLPDDDAVELPFLQNVKEAVEVFLQKEDDAVNTSLQNMEKVLETSQNEETIQIALQCEEAVGMSSLHDEGDIEMSLHEDETVKASLQDNKDIQLPLQIDGESVDMSYLPDDDGVELPFLQNVKEAVEVFLQKEDADVNASLHNGKKVLVTSQNEVVELSSQNEKETVQIALQRENETIDMSPLYEEKEDIEITLKDKKAETSLLHDEKAVQNSLQNEEPVEISLHEKVDKGISLHEDKETNEITSPHKKTVKISCLHEKEATGMSLLHDKESIGIESLSNKADEMSLHDMETEKSYLCKKDVNDNFSPTLEGKTISVSENKASVTSNKPKNIDNTEDIFVRSPYDEAARRVMFLSASKDLENPEKFQKINENEEVHNKFSKKESHIFKENTVGGQNGRTVGLSDASCENKTGGSEMCNEVFREEASCISRKTVLPNSPNQNVCEDEPIYPDRKTIETELNIEALDLPKKKDTATSSSIPNKEINPDKVKLPDKGNILPDLCIPSDEEIQQGFKENTVQKALDFLMNETID